MALYFSAQLGKPQIPSAIAWITLAVNAPLMGWVVIKLQSGLVGAAWVTTGSYGVMLACYLVFFSMKTGLFNPLLLFIPQRRDFERARRLVRDVLSRGGV